MLTASGHHAEFSWDHHCMIDKVLFNKWENVCETASVVPGTEQKLTVSVFSLINFRLQVDLCSLIIHTLNTQHLRM